MINSSSGPHEALRICPLTQDALHNSTYVLLLLFVSGCVAILRFRGNNIDHAVARFLVVVPHTTQRYVMAFGVKAQCEPSDQPVQNA
jgi:hypothetical protein